MRKINFLSISVLILLNNFIFINLQSEIKNKIVVKVGESLITSIDVQNEIVTNLIIANQEVTAENINNNKNYAIKNLINKKIKRNEINKYEINNYSKKDLQDFITKIAKNLNTNQNGLKEIFKKTNIDYQIFIEKHETELLWNTLIFQLYRNQTNINVIDVDNEVAKIKGNKSEEELKKIKNDIENKRKEEKFNLFSRSHFSNLENTVVINFQ
jgi:predicted CopG family antitoxin